jgi:hypothetical protein
MIPKKRQSSGIPHLSEVFVAAKNTLSTLRNHPPPGEMHVLCRRDERDKREGRDGREGRRGRKAGGVPREAYLAILKRALPASDEIRETNDAERRADS